MIKTLLDGDIVPSQFHAQVADLTLRFFSMISSLLPQRVILEYFPSEVVTDEVAESNDEGDENNANNDGNNANNDGNNTNNKVVKTDDEQHFNHPVISGLWSIIDYAAKISLDMRREETIYYVSSPAKLSIFDDDLMNCLNKRQIKRTSNWKEDDEVPLVKIVGFPSIVAYRPGNGWEEGEDDGYRMRMVSKAEVVLEWRIERVVPGTGDGIENGNGTTNGTGNGNGNGANGQITLKDAITRSKPSSWFRSPRLLEWVTEWK